MQIFCGKQFTFWEKKSLKRNALKVIFEKLLTEYKKEGTLIYPNLLFMILLQLVCGKNVLIYRNKSHPILCTLSVGCSPANGSSKIGLDFQCTQWEKGGMGGLHEVWSIELSIYDCYCSVCECVLVHTT